MGQPSFFCEAYGRRFPGYCFFEVYGHCWHKVECLARMAEERGRIRALAHAWLASDDDGMRWVAEAILSIPEDELLRGDGQLPPAAD